MPVGPIPVRLTKDQISRIDAAAKAMGTTRTGVIKICLLAFLQRFEREGLGMLPPDWGERLKDQDGRTHRYGPSGPGHKINQVGDNNMAIGGDFKSASGVPAQKPVRGRKGKQGKTENNK